MGASAYTEAGGEIWIGDFSFEKDGKITINVDGRCTIADCEKVIEIIRQYMVYMSEAFKEEP